MIIRHKSQWDFFYGIFFNKKKNTSATDGYTWHNSSFHVNKRRKTDCQIFKNYEITTLAKLWTYLKQQVRVGPAKNHDHETDQHQTMQQHRQKLDHFSYAILLKYYPLWTP